MVYFNTRSFLTSFAACSLFHAINKIMDLFILEQNFMNFDLPPHVGFLVSDDPRGTFSLVLRGRVDLYMTYIMSVPTTFSPRALDLVQEF